MKLRTTAATTLAILALTGAGPAAAITEVFTDAGATTADIQEGLAAYRAELGGGDTSSGGGLFGGVRREINWDGASDAVSTPPAMPTSIWPSAILLAMPMAACRPVTQAICTSAAGV